MLAHSLSLCNYLSPSLPRVSCHRRFKWFFYFRLELFLFFFFVLFSLQDFLVWLLLLLLPLFFLSNIFLLLFAGN